MCWLYFIYFVFCWNQKSVRVCSCKSKLFKMQFNSSYGKTANSVLTGISKLPPEWIENISIWLYICWSLKAAAGMGCGGVFVLLHWSVFCHCKVRSPTERRIAASMPVPGSLLSCALYLNRVKASISLSPPSPSRRSRVSGSVVPLWGSGGLSLLGCTGAGPLAASRVITSVK